MQWVRAACVRPAPCMRVCARSYLGRASIAKTVVDILQQLQFKKSVCLFTTRKPTRASVLSPHELQQFSRHSTTPADQPQTDHAFTW